MTKKELRKYYLEKRENLSNSEINKLSEQISNVVISGIPKSIKTIHLFVSIPNSKEIQTKNLIKYLWENDFKVITSVTKFNPKRLEHSIITDQTIFTPGIYDVPVPFPIIPIDLKEIEFVFIPLLCADNRGNRIGYGQGFYDGFLGQLNPSAKKIGLSIFPPTEMIIPTDEWDIPLNSLVTPEGWITFD